MLFITFFCIAILSTIHSGHGISWQSAALLNDGAQTKTPICYGSKFGGFHAKWENSFQYSSPWFASYRRYHANGQLGPIVQVHPGFSVDGNIIETPSGGVWMTWENWDDAKHGEQGFAAFSSDNGTTWDIIDVTHFHYSNGEGGQAKQPTITLLNKEGSQLLFTVWRAVYNQLLYSVSNDGKNWSPLEEIQGSDVDSQYWNTGQAWQVSAGNGLVWRAYGTDKHGGTDVFARYFDGNSWSNEFRLSKDQQFFAWPSVAANDFSEVMVAWERNSNIYANYYDGSNWKGEMHIGSGNLPSVTSIPGLRNFYVTYTDGAAQAILGNLFSNGAWQNTDVVSTSLPRKFTSGSSACSDGTKLYCVWEYWGSGNPQAYYSVASI